MFNDEYTISPKLLYPVIAALIVFAVIVPMRYKIMVACVGLLLFALYHLIPIVWLVRNWRRIKKEWTDATATIAKLEVISYADSDRIFFTAETVDEEGMTIPFDSRCQWVWKPHVGQTLRVLYDRKQPSDFLIVPAYKLQAAGQILMTVLCIAAGVAGIWLTLK